MTVPESPLPLWRRWRRLFYHQFLRVLLQLAERLPLPLGRFQGRWLGRLAWHLRRRERQRAESNLALVFPEMGTQHRRELARRSTLRLGENLHDTLAAPRLARRPGFVVEEALQGRPSLAEELRTLAAAGDGVLVLTGHLGCWELLGAALARRVQAEGLGELAVVTGTIHNPAVDRMVQDRRGALGMKVMPRDEGAGPLVRHLRAGGVAAVLMDQNTRVDNLEVPFFGHPAPTAAGFARLALKRGCPILPVAMARLGQGHEIRRGVVIHPPTGSVGEDAVRRLLRECNSRLEDFIRRNPEEWVWFHQRWDDEPAGPAVRHRPGQP